MCLGQQYINPCAVSAESEMIQIRILLTVFKGKGDFIMPPYCMLLKCMMKIANVVPA